MESRDGYQINEQYRINPEGGGKTKVANASKLTKSVGPVLSRENRLKN